jgi:hypothetical protein
VLAFTEFRMRPQRSTSQVASNGSWNCVVADDDERVGDVEVVPDVEFVPDPNFDCVTDGEVVTVGNSCARASPTRARATR